MSELRIYAAIIFCGVLGAIGTIALSFMGAHASAFWMISCAEAFVIGYFVGQLRGAWFTAQAAGPPARGTSSG